MKIYQVYRWDNTDGPKVTFYANKQEATQAAETFVKETDNDGNIEVSKFYLYTTRYPLIKTLNNLSATSPYYDAELVASYDSEEVPDYNFDSFYEGE